MGNKDSVNLSISGSFFPEMPGNIARTGNNGGNFGKTIGEKLGNQDGTEQISLDKALDEFGFYEQYANPVSNSNSELPENKAASVENSSKPKEHYLNEDQVKQIADKAASNKDIFDNPKPYKVDYSPEGLERLSTCYDIFKNKAIEGAKRIGYKSAEHAEQIVNRTIKQYFLEYVFSEKSVEETKKMQENIINGKTQLSFGLSMGDTLSVSSYEKQK